MKEKIIKTVMFFIKAELGVIVFFSILDIINFALHDEFKFIESLFIVDNILLTFVVFIFIFFTIEIIDEMEKELKNHNNK